MLIVSGSRASRFFTLATEMDDFFEDNLFRIPY